MAKYKNRHRIPDNVPPGQKPTPCWFYFLTAHALIHGGCVWVVASLWLACIFDYDVALCGGVLFAAIETISHWLIDFAKCENVTGPHEDQILHGLVKVFLAAIISGFLKYA